MFNSNVVIQAMEQQNKENYIINSLIRVLYGNNLNDSERFHIVEEFTRRVLR